MTQNQIIEELTRDINSMIDGYSRSLSSRQSTLFPDLASVNYTSSSEFFIQENQKAHLYPLMAGGKRVRPLLILLTALSVGKENAKKLALASALAVEMVHTYSLVHDDLPCMDNDDLRRGLPTTHKIYGEAKGLLVGDGLLTDAFLILTELTKDLAIFENVKNELTVNLIQILATASGTHGMALGQWLDLSFENTDSQTEIELSNVLLVHALKTGKLLSASLEMGLCCGLSSRNESLGPFQIARTLIKEAGIHFGLTFQLIDDILDHTESSETLGKTAGKDQAQKKLTAVSVLGLEKTKELAIKHTIEGKKSLQLSLSLAKNVNSEENEMMHETLIAFIESLLQRNF